MQSFRQLLYNRATDFTAVASFTAEHSLLSGFSQPVLWHPAMDFTQVGRQFRLSGRGIVSCTATPTFTLAIRLGPTKMTGDNQTSPSGTVVGTTTTLTCTSGANSVFEFALNLMLATPAVGSNATITSAGLVLCPVFSPAVADLAPTYQNATWTTTTDISVDNYFQVTAACSASSASNTIQLKHLELEALN